MDFNFITDEKFRDSLVADFGELTHALNSKLWKSVHVLSGSIIEALLIEYIVVFKPSSVTKDPLKMDLSEAIEACQNAGVIQKSTASLCDVVRDYRNLIHPGRMIRLERDANEEGATIAKTLVALIAKEIAQKRKDTYGPTAEQIAKKLITDEHINAVLAQLLTEANQHERWKLVEQLIPESYVQEQAFIPDDTVLARLRGGFRKTFELLSENEKRLIAGKFARLVRLDSTEKIQSYGDAFFSADDIEFLSKPDRDIVVGHLLSRIDTCTGVDEGLVGNSVSLGKFMELTEMAKFADTLIRLVLRQPSSTLDAAVIFASRAYDQVESEKKEALEQRLKTWQKNAEKRNQAQQQQRLENISAQWIDVPF